MIEKTEIQDLKDDLLGLMAAVSVLMQAAPKEVGEAALIAQTDTLQKLNDARQSGG